MEPLWASWSILTRGNLHSDPCPAGPQGSGAWLPVSDGAPALPEPSRQQPPLHGEAILRPGQCQQVTAVGDGGERVGLAGARPSFSGRFVFVEFWVKWVVFITIAVVYRWREGSRLRSLPGFTVLAARWARRGAAAQFVSLKQGDEVEIIGTAVVDCGLVLFFFSTSDLRHPQMLIKASWSRELRTAAPREVRSGWILSDPSSSRGPCLPLALLIAVNYH